MCSRLIAMSCLPTWFLPLGRQSCMPALLGAHLSWTRLLHELRASVYAAACRPGGVALLHHGDPLNLLVLTRRRRPRREGPRPVSSRTDRTTGYAERGDTWGVILAHAQSHLRSVHAMNQRARDPTRWVSQANRPALEDYPLDGLADRFRKDAVYRVSQLESRQQRTAANPMLGFTDVEMAQEQWEALFNIRPLPPDSPFRTWAGGSEAAFKDFILEVRLQETSVVIDGRRLGRAEAANLYPQLALPDQAPLALCDGDNPQGGRPRAASRPSSPTRRARQRTGQKGSGARRPTQARRGSTGSQAASSSSWQWQADSWWQDGDWWSSATWWQ